MKQITTAEARQLVANKEAGWWSPAANPPIPHPTQYVVTVDKDVHFLTEQFCVKPVEPVLMSYQGRLIPKMAHEVTAEGDIVALVKEAIEKSQRIKLDGIDMVTYYGGNLQGP